VTIKETPSRGEGEISSKGVRRAVMRQVVETHRAAGLNNCLPAFDGYKILFTARELPNDINTFEIALPDKDGQARQAMALYYIPGMLSSQLGWKNGSFCPTRTVTDQGQELTHDFFYPEPPLYLYLDALQGTPK
jgi:hypothetical protein